MKISIDTPDAPVNLEIIDFKNTVKLFKEIYESTTCNIIKESWFYESGAYALGVPFDNVVISNGYSLANVMYISSPGITHHVDLDGSSFNVLIPTRGFDKYTMNYISLFDKEISKTIRKGDVIAFMQSQLHSLAPIRPTIVPFEAILLCIKRCKYVRTTTKT